MAPHQRPGSNNIIGVPGAGSRYSQRGAPPAGFIAGLWHGFIAPISTFASVGNPMVQTHQTYNTGRWYALGYRIGSANPFALE